LVLGKINLEVFDAHIVFSCQNQIFNCSILKFIPRHGHHLCNVSDSSVFNVKERNCLSSQYLQTSNGYCDVRYDIDTNHLEYSNNEFSPLYKNDLLQVVDEDKLNVLERPLNATEDAGVLTREK